MIFSHFVLSRIEVPSGGAAFRLPHLLNGLARTNICSMAPKRWLPSLSAKQIEEYIYHTYVYIYIYIDYPIAYPHLQTHLACTDPSSIRYRTKIVLNFAIFLLWMRPLDPSRYSSVLQVGHMFYEEI